MVPPHPKVSMLIERDEKKNKKKQRTGDPCSNTAHILSMKVMSSLQIVEYVKENIIKVIKSCLTVCNPMDFSPLGSAVHGISQARTLEWVAISYSRGSSRPRDQTHGSLHWQVDF